MIKRYSWAFGAGIFVTAGLIYWMQQMIAGGELPVETRKPVHVQFAEIIPDPPKPRERRQPPDRPDTPAEQPRVQAVTESRTDRTATVTGIIPTLPGLPSSNDRRGPYGLTTGEFGPSTNDGEMQPMMRATPLYPHTAELRGLEGHVIVEFMVRADGTVADIKVIESTHPVFERAAIDAAERSRYQPRIVDGAAVAVAGVRTMFEFQLEN